MRHTVPKLRKEYKQKESEIAGNVVLVLQSRIKWYLVNFPVAFVMERGDIILIKWVGPSKNGNDCPANVRQNVWQNETIGL